MNARRILAVAAFCVLNGTCFGQTANQRAWNSPVSLHPVSADTFSFVILGDRTGAGPDAWGVLDRAIREANRLKPYLVVHIGDIVEGGNLAMALRLQWQEAFRHLDSLRGPLFLVPGNHDIRDPAGYAAWTDLFGRTFQCFDVGGTRFLILNTEERFQVPGAVSRVEGSVPAASTPSSGAVRPAGDGKKPEAAAREPETRNPKAGVPDSGFGQDQMEFILDSIRKLPKPNHLFVFMHQPAWLFSGDLRTQWNAVESGLSGIPHTVFAGHLHLLAGERRPDGFYCIVGPTGGSLRLAPNPALGLMNHITRVSVRGGSVHVEFLSAGRVYSESAALEAREKGLEVFLLFRSIQMD